jgi:hypothetical protein
MRSSTMHGGGLACRCKSCFSQQQLSRHADDGSGEVMRCMRLNDVV